MCAIIPPYVLEQLERHAERAVHEPARETLRLTAELARRRARPDGPAAAGERRSVYDLHGTTALPGTPARGDGDPPNADDAVNRAYDAAGVVYDFFEHVFGRASIDGHGMSLVSSVHYGKRFDNAFWDGAEMVYGDGDGIVFNDFTAHIDVIAHEMTHGITQHTCGLAYWGQAGALNESLSDVFGSLVKQWQAKQTAAAADWLIGAGLFTARVHGQALRSMRAPGTAYDEPMLGGRDPQPAHMRDFVDTAADNGGVHVNSGIPNHAFYLAATTIGGYAWETAGAIWYAAQCSALDAHASFRDFADATIRCAVPHGRTAEAAVRHAWESVGVRARRGTTARDRS